MMGEWIIELVLLFLAANIGFKLIKKIFGLLPSICSLLLWMLAFTGIISGGNYATEYTLSQQSLIVEEFLVDIVLKKPRLIIDSNNSETIYMSLKLTHL